MSRPDNDVWSAPKEPFFPPRMLHAFTHSWCFIIEDNQVQSGHQTVFIIHRKLALPSPAEAQHKNAIMKTMLGVEKTFPVHGFPVAMWFHTVASFVFFFLNCTSFQRWKKLVCLLGSCKILSGPQANWSFFSLHSEMFFKSYRFIEHFPLSSRILSKQ